jgi:hypothetical protein
MPPNSLQQTYVRTKKNSIPALQTSDLNIQSLDYRFGRAHIRELTPSDNPHAAGLNGRWLQIPTAECWELLFQYTGSPAEAPDHSQRHPSQ